MKLGFIDVDGMLDSIPSSLLTEWMAYYEIDPFGEDIDDLRHGVTAAMVANANRGKGQPPIKPDELMIQRGPRQPQKQQTPAEMRAVIRAAFKKVA